MILATSGELAGASDGALTQLLCQAEFVTAAGTTVSPTNSTAQGITTQTTHRE
jgi:hypothetical protein